MNVKALKCAGVILTVKFESFNVNKFLLIEENNGYIYIL